jgi:hypothetical protein
MALGVGLVVALTIVLLASGVLSNAAQVTAYATTVLAVGTVGLAVGAIGTYLEQRDTNRQQADQLTAAETADIAQVMIVRNTGPGQLVVAHVSNGSSRAIRDIYVWADVRSITGRYHTAISGGGSTARGMRNIPHGPNLYWQYRALLPGQDAQFHQLQHMNDQPVPESVPDGDITVYAEFTDVHGKWWRVDEDGNVNQIQPEPTPAPPPNPINPATMFGITGKTAG